VYGYGRVVSGLIAGAVAMLLRLLFNTLPIVSEYDALEKLLIEKYQALLN
jgi:hypothetical protein